MQGAAGAVASIRDVNVSSFRPLAQANHKFVEPLLVFSRFSLVKCNTNLPTTVGSPEVLQS